MASKSLHGIHSLTRADNCFSLILSFSTQADGSNLLHVLQSLSRRESQYTLVDHLIMPDGSSFRISDEFDELCWKGKFRTVSCSSEVGHGLESSENIPVDTLLFPYLGEFISSREASKRHEINKSKQVP